MDPLSIATGCVSLISGIMTLTMRITVFVSEVRNSRKDMDAVARELTSLHLCLGALKNDDQNRGIEYPELMREQIYQIILNCDVVVQQMNDMLIKLSSGRLGRRIQWSFSEKGDMDKLRSSLESNKSALEAALTVGTISMLAEQKKHLVTASAESAAMLAKAKTIDATTRKIHAQVGVLADIKKDTAKIKDIDVELTNLRIQLGDLGKERSGPTAEAFKMFSEQIRLHATALIQPYEPLLRQEQAKLESKPRQDSMVSAATQTTCSIVASKAGQSMEDFPVYSFPDTSKTVSVTSSQEQDEELRFLEQALERTDANLVATLQRNQTLELRLQDWQRTAATLKAEIEFLELRDVDTVPFDELEQAIERRNGLRKLLEQLIWSG